MNSYKPPTVSDDIGEIIARINHSEPVQLFLDYDGTLAEFAPTPDDVFPDEELIQILRDLKLNPCVQVMVVSGRRLSHVRRLVPVEGIVLAGSYGIELLTLDGGIVYRFDYNEVRPKLEMLKPQWETQVSGREGFYLEDKGWSLAIHARFANEDEANTVLQGALETAQKWIDRDLFNILIGHKFLEARPKIANKGDAIKYLLEQYPLKGALPVCVGDDYTDEEAFPVINAHGGITILVADEPRATEARCRLDSPDSVRIWLRTLNPSKDITHTG